MLLSVCPSVALSNSFSKSLIKKKCILSQCPLCIGYFSAAVTNSTTKGTYELWFQMFGSTAVGKQGSNHRHGDWSSHRELTP